MRQTDELTDRELEVLLHLANGLATREIASEMYLGYETVKDHLGSLRRKLGARSQLQIVLAAARQGLLPEDHPLGGREVLGPEGAPSPSP
jgi:DNA-binding CsgD family transcriptional regulator